MDPKKFWYFLALFNPLFLRAFFSKKHHVKNHSKTSDKKKQNCVKNHGKSSDKKKRYLFFLSLVLPWFFTQFFFEKKALKNRGLKSAKKYQNFLGSKMGPYIHFNEAIMLSMCFQSKSPTRFYSLL